MCNGHFSEGKNETQRHCIKADKKQSHNKYQWFSMLLYQKKPYNLCRKEVEFTNKDIVTKKSVLIKPALSVACFILLIACVLSLSKIINNISPKVFAYISVDINPSFEIEIDDMGNVLNLLPLNDDAKVIADKWF